jgi:hypothetical protein
LYIHHYLQWHNDTVSRDGIALYQAAEKDPQQIPADIYRQMGLSYAKFFKMDLLSRVAFLASELVIPQPVTENKDHIATILSTTSGCLDVDKKFEESRQTLASPALFVYTLPNIMLGEICIRNGFKGEQMCTIADGPDASWFDFYAYDLLQYRGTEACLCGYAEATEHKIEAAMFWVSKVPTALPFSMDSLNAIFNHK